MDKTKERLDLEALKKRVIAHSAKYGGNDELFIRDFPQYDRRKSKVYTPKVAPKK